jgi:hypothetical protein
MHQHQSSRNLHLQYLANNQSTQRCQSLITPGSDHPLVLEPHMVLTLLGLANFWDLLWCLGLPANSRVLLNPLPRQSMLPQLVVALSSFGSHTP